MASAENRNATEPPMRQTDERLRVGDVDRSRRIGEQLVADDVQVELVLDGLDVGGEQRDGGDDRGADREPFVTALVVLPTASRLTMMRAGSPSNSPDISAMPAALSATGPKVSSDTTTPVVASMPMPVSATR